MPDSAVPRNPFFPLTAFFGALFIVTILALVAGLFGDPQAPLAQVLDRHAGWLLTLEAAGLLLSGFLALVVDRRQTLAAKEPPSDVSRESGSPENTQANEQSRHG
ncbi:MAG: hypothetical protein EXS05_02815 [Planctomycetaceae bacterium]|nr:hypothetical protein [Planctomycetaceae bacterium]